MIEKLKIKDFDTIYKLMEMSFPSDEYRSYHDQQALLDDPFYSIYVFRSDSRDIKAFISVWEFNKFAFIEHFVVNPEHRNGGIGSSVLSEIVEKVDKTVCLEVEPPETQIASRRISFYQRNNFFFNEYPYRQPPLSQKKKSIPLFIMTSDSKVDKHIFEQIKATLYSQVYQ